MDSRMRPQSEYVHQASWQQLFALTKHWQTDLLFYQDEIRFFRRLMENKLVWLEKDKNIEDLRSLGNRLAVMAEGLKGLQRSLAEHLQRVTEFEQQTSHLDQKSFRTEHVLLEDLFTEFIKGFRQLKKEIFECVEHVVETEGD